MTIPKVPIIDINLKFFIEKHEAYKTKTDVLVLPAQKTLKIFEVRHGLRLESHFYKPERLMIFSERTIEEVIPVLETKYNNYHLTVTKYIVKKSNNKDFKREATITMIKKR